VETLILKLGGGAITHKDDNERRARTERLVGVAAQVARAQRERPGRGLVVVHGAGPFGHKLVTDYGISRGVKEPRQVEGFVRTHDSMEVLNRIVVEIFLEAGLLAFPIQPSACALQRDGRLETLLVEPIQRLLEMDPSIVPVLYGDMVLDRTLGASVVSGDTLVVQLARELGASRVLLGTDVAGVHTADPKRDPDARRIERIDASNLDELVGAAGEASTVDVTGGMGGKLRRLVQGLVGIEALIFDLAAPEATYRALVGEPVEGTVISIG
jgi:isopentenyl phosphate kinase